MPLDNSHSGTTSDAASDLGKKVGEQLDNGRIAAADRIASAAWNLEGHAEELPGGKRVASIAHVTADKLTSASDYIREHDLTAMLLDAKTIVKNHPVPALIGAAALGFLLAKALSRD